MALSCSIISMALKLETGVRTVTDLRQDVRESAGMRSSLSVVQVFLNSGARESHRYSKMRIVRIIPYGSQTFLCSASAI